MRLKEVKSLSTDKYKVYLIEEGVMALRDMKDKKLYFFPERNAIDPAKIIAKNTLQKDLELIYSKEM